MPGAASIAGRRLGRIRPDKRADRGGQPHSRRRDAGSVAGDPHFGRLLRGADDLLNLYVDVSVRSHQQD